MKILTLTFVILLLFGCQEAEVPKSTSTKTEVKTPDLLYPLLFEEVQMTSVFPDSKTFVDCTAKLSATKINELYAEGKKKPDFDLTAFINQNFIVPPSISSDFKADMTKTASEHVKSLWPVLTRTADQANQGSTLLPLPKNYIVPGGRFREVYYWDSYFTMLGLIEDNEIELVENINDNFAHLIKTIGHIPNGNRSYYHTRSQPPFFSQMVKLLADVKGDEIYKKYHEALKGEYAFWMNQKDGQEVFEHVVKSSHGKLNRYYDKGSIPRQESYKEDFELVEEYKGDGDMYRHIRSGAESGWDYSSRWFADGQNMSTIETTDILPIDLNALLYGLEEILLKLEKESSDFAKELSASMKTRKDFMNEICWNSDGSYEDYNWKTKQQTGKKSLAMMYPLFFNMVPQEKADAVAKYIETNFLKPGGVVSTLYNTSQQWDAPNGWAPLQWMTVEGLRNYGHDTLADKIATRWISINEKVYQSTGKFVEKYNVEDLSLEAGGGEYPVQDGFGWSNGVYLAFKNQMK
ncbi:alpha,alpha-trehalase TreF [Saprospiraceae bacterium]|nr:alpha,alpha-trehalase TreF [Saprospiraceae bacterium]